MSIYLERIFSQILEMSIIAGYCVLAVLVLRWLFRKAPKKYTYLLWLIVAFRLVCPLTVDSAFSIFNLKLLPESMKTESEVGGDHEELPETNVPSVKPEDFPEAGDNLDKLPELGGSVVVQPGVFPEQDSNLGEQPGTAPGIGGNLGQQPNVKPEMGGSVIETPGKLPETPSDVEQAPQTRPLREIDWMKIGAWVWVAGMVCLTATMVTSWIRLKLRVRTAVKVRTRVYETDAIDSAFVLGIRKPTIYLPVGLDRQEQAWVLLHETSHIRRKDYLVKIIATVLTIVYWFNPLVWVAWFGMCRDMEMSCDEMALEGADAELRKAYSRTLLTVATQKRINWNAITAFGEVSV
ncbi:MAG: M56 family metallopeptidase, partial [Lachnospiraceae bacterium]|nr:M56 family metallopeptidase [Lachnospiraceae bacterium]